MSNDTTFNLDQAIDDAIAEYDRRVAEQERLQAERREAEANKAIKESLPEFLRVLGADLEQALNLTYNYNIPAVEAKFEYVGITWTLTRWGNGSFGLSQPDYATQNYRPEDLRQNLLLTLGQAKRAQMAFTAEGT